MLPHLKICGITRRQDALACSRAGVGALGAVFYPRSPRNVSAAQARELFAELPQAIARVGVFVNAAPEAVIQTARDARLTTAQLHGTETLEDALAIHRAGFHVVKVLKHLDSKLFIAARALPPQIGILVECGVGVLPGGNAAAWNWADAAPLAQIRPFAIAGGLNPANLAEAARISRAAGLDVSSGVESAPGIKDESAIRALVRAAAELPPPAPPFFWKGIP
jgi:phosphoribosylanthranilate isomerase